MGDLFTVGRDVFQVSDYVIEERCGQHDLLIVTGTGKSLSAYAGKPAALSVNLGSNSRLIAGYIDTHAMSMGFQHETIDAVYMLGASSVMRSGSSRKWRDKRPFEIACDVVRPYGFCLEMDTFKYTIPLFTQSTESDWQLLNRLAAEVGMALIGTNTVIRIIDPIMEIRRRKMRPLYTADVTKLSDYKVSQNPVPLGYEGRVFSGIDKFGQSFSVTANPGAPVVLPAPETVKSLGDAFSAAERIEKRRHRLKQASVVLKYYPILRSGTTLALTNGYETNVWFVVESRHTYTHNDRLVTALTLNRDDDDLRTAKDIWNGSKWPTPTLLRDRWVSSVIWQREL